MAVVAVKEREPEMNTDIRELNVGEMEQVSGASVTKPSLRGAIREVEFAEFVRAMFASTKGAGPAPAGAGPAPQ
jgi:hypothetical protein